MLDSAGVQRAYVVRFGHVLQFFAVEFGAEFESAVKSRPSAAQRDRPVLYSAARGHRLYVVRFGHVLQFFAVEFGAESEFAVKSRPSAALRERAA